MSWRSLAAGLALLLAGWSCWRVLGPRRPQRPALIAPLMARMDRDGDGRLDQQEFQALAPAATALEIYDLDDDGWLESWELERQLLRLDTAWFACAAQHEEPAP